LSVMLVPMLFRDFFEKCLPLGLIDQRGRSLGVVEVRNSIERRRMIGSPAPGIVHQGETNATTDVIEGFYCPSDGLVAGDQIWSVNIGHEKLQPSPARIEEFSLPKTWVGRVVDAGLLGIET